MSLVALLASLLCGSSGHSWFAGGQIVSERMRNHPMFVVGTRRGNWDLWGGVSGDAYVEKLREFPLDFGLWWTLCLWTGATWNSRDSGVSQIAGLQFRWLRIQPNGTILPTGTAQLDPLWGIRWSGDGLRADASIGPSFQWLSTDAILWSIEVEPVFRVGIAKVW